jgi:predicted MPP superfamily phosphohydrolase
MTDAGSKGTPVTRQVCWLHLSDLHAYNPTGWDSKRITSTLKNDLLRLREDFDLCPDLIFFSGDLAYGQMGSQREMTLADQFDIAN